jgi:hypothetical protein
MSFYALKSCSYNFFNPFGVRLRTQKQQLEQLLFGQQRQRRTNDANLYTQNLRQPPRKRHPKTLVLKKIKYVLYGEFFIALASFLLNKSAPFTA